MTVYHARWAVRLVGLVMLALGLVIWTGSADALIPIHMLVGFVFVMALWTVAFLAESEGASRSLAIVAFALGLALPLLGASQERILAGSEHWIVQIIHLALGVTAIGLGEALTGQARRAALARSTPGTAQADEKAQAT